MSTPDANNILYHKLESDSFLRASNVNTRLSLLGKELYDNIENLILDENILGNYFKKRNLDKKTIYSSNKFTLNLDELNSDSISVENILIEEKHKDILFKGEDEGEIEEPETIEETKPETKKEITGKDIFKDIFADIENNDTGVKKEENINDNEDKDKKTTSNLFQDISDYNQELNENKKYAEDKEMNNIFDILSDDENEKKEKQEKIEEKEKLEKEKKELEEQEKKKDILKEEYYPIDVIEEAEKYYNLSNESKEDLYPLNTYKINNGLSVEFLKLQDSNISTPIPGIITVIGSDQENNLYICTNNGKIIKKGNAEVLFQTGKNKEYKNYEEPISCIGVVDNLVVTGDETGNIAIWSNNILSRILFNLNDNNKIICIKIIELIGNHLTLVFSDIKGNFNLIKAHIVKNTEIKNNELECEYTPIYNILLFPNDISYIKSEKQNIIMLLVSPQYAGIYRLYPETAQLDKLKIFEYTYGEIGKFIFDVSSGLGFPPVSDLSKGRLGSQSSAASRGSISNNIIIGNEDEETSMIAISYGNVLQIYGIRISDKNEIKPIGFIINDRPIIRNCFVANSLIAIMTDNLNIKLINTYDFIPRVYNQQSDTNVTKNFLISYEYLNLNNSGLNGDMLDFDVNNKRIRKIIYNNKVIVNNNSIYYVSDEGINVQRIDLSNYDEVLGKLCDKEDYIRMLWLLSIITNKKTNLLNRQLNKIDKNFNEKSKKSLCDLYLMRFFIAKTIPELQNKNEIYARMLLEFFIETENFETFLEYMQMLKNYELDKYIYSNLTKYITNGDLSEMILNQVLLNNYIEYYINQKEKLLLNKVLLKLNIDTLLQKDVLRIISEKELINPYIYTRIKNIKEGKIDYFLPALYLDSVFKKEYLEKKNEEMMKQYLTPEQLELFNKQLIEKKEEMKEEIEKNLNISNDYKKLIIEHNMNYFNEDTFSCHEYIGHKFLWYCNKCLSGKEYPNDTQMSPNNFKETAIKILAFLITKENLKLYLEFDSYTYLQIILQYFLNQKLFNLIYGYEQNFTQNVKDFINEHLGENADKDFNAFKVYITIKDSLKDVDINKYFLKYDFYVMTCEISTKVRDFIFERKDVIDALIYFSELDLADYHDEKDPYNCHRKVEGEKEIKKFKEKIEKYMINLLDYLKSYNLLIEDLVKELLKKRRIYNYKKVYFYLCEESGNYKECLDLKLLEYEKNKDVYSEKDKKELFNWIKKIHLKTINIEKSSEEFVELNKEFKKLLLKYLNQLCLISIEKLSKVIDECFNDNNEKEELIRHLGEGQSSELQLKYLDEYFKLNEKDMNENIEKYVNYLEMEMDILIKNRNKRRIKKLLMDYKILCNNTIFRKLEKNRINDCCIYICQYQGKVKEGVALTIKEVKQKYKNIKEVLNKPNFNPKLVDLELKEMYKYFELGLDVCQNNVLNEDKENKKMDDSWLDLFKTACEFKIDFYPRYENNKNNNKTYYHKKIFNGLQNCIELILEKIIDNISLKLLVEIIAENCKKLKSIEFYTFLDRSFYSFRRSEQIFNCAKNLMETSILIQYDEQSQLKTVGHHLLLEGEKCNFCKFKLKSNTNNSHIEFNCGHKYHVNCCWEENNTKVCYVCRMIEIKGDEEKIKMLKEAQAPPELSYLEKENLEKQELKKEEKEKRKGLKSRLNTLQKIKKKRKEIDAYLISNEMFN